MNCKDFLKVYQRGEKYLLLNPLTPAWIVTNLNGVLTVKIFVENQSFEKTVEEFGKYAENIFATSFTNFLKKVCDKGLFKVPHAPFFHKPYTLRAVYLNMTANCNLNCIYCFTASRKERNSTLNLDDYKKILDAVKNYNTHAEIIFTGGEPLLSEFT